MGSLIPAVTKLSPQERENTGLMAPCHALRREINGRIRERLARDGVIHGSAFKGERLVSHGHTSAEKAVAANYSHGDVVAFHRAYRSLGVAKGDERRVADFDHRMGIVMLEGPEGRPVSWRPRLVGAKRGAVEVYRTEGMDLRAGDRVRWMRNDAGLGLVNGDTAEVLRVRGDSVAFRLGDGQTLELGRDGPQMRHLDHAWAATVHAFQGRAVDNLIAVMEARHPKLSTQKSFHVEISRARHGPELVTDDARALREPLEAATGERVSALEGIGAAERVLSEGKAQRGEKERGRGPKAMPDRPAGTQDNTVADKSREPEREQAQEPERAAGLEKSRGSRGFEMEM